MRTIQGFVLIDVDVAALNNAGGDTSTTLENAVATKKIRKNGGEYPYVSGQAWRYWWRETLKKDFGWNMSPIVREKKIAFTEADPFAYPDDDIFGYMRAKKIEVEDTETKKTIKKNVTLTRVSPLKNSALIAVAHNQIVKNWASMTRQEGDAVPYAMDEYCAVMKGMFSIALDQVGTFSMSARTGFHNINEAMKTIALQNGSREIDDPIEKDANGNPLKLMRISKEIRLQRIKDTLSALKTLSGGAKLTTNYADVTPKLIVLATLKSGNHPFSHLAKEEGRGQAMFSIKALREVISDYSEQIDGKVLIGRRSGFMDELEQELMALRSENVIDYGSITKIIDTFVNGISLE